MWPILRAWTQFIVTWWNQDRIRVSRVEGQMFRIVEGDRLIIADTVLQVVHRHETALNGTAEINFALRELESNSEDLWYLVYTNECAELGYGSNELYHRERGSEHIQLHRHGESIELFPNQVSMLRRDSLRSN